MSEAHLFNRLESLRQMIKANSATLIAMFPAILLISMNPWGVHHSRVKAGIPLICIFWKIQI